MDFHSSFLAVRSLPRFLQTTHAARREQRSQPLELRYESSAKVDVDDGAEYENLS
jgi:hypothetical protein